QYHQSFSSCLHAIHLLHLMLANVGVTSASETQTIDRCRFGSKGRDDTRHDMASIERLQEAAGFRRCREASRAGQPIDRLRKTPRTFCERLPNSVVRGPLYPCRLSST